MSSRREPSDEHRLVGIREMVEAAQPGDLNALWSAESDFRWLLTFADAATRRAEQAESAVELLLTRVRDFAATWHTSLGHDGHLDRCTWSTCRGLLTGSIDSGTELRAALTDTGAGT